MPTAKQTARTAHVYVIELEDAVRHLSKFEGRNPDCRADKPCLYVGRTSRTPEERFEQHKTGIKASRIVKRYGVRLRPRYYAKLNPMTGAEADKMEIELARRLRKRGFWVWQN